MSFIHKYPVLAFFVFALILGTSLIILVFQGIIPNEFALASVLSASLAGIIMTASLDGKAGLKLLFSRIFIWRVGLSYWIFAVFFLVPVIFLGSQINPLFNETVVSLSNPKLDLSIVPMFLAFFVVVGLGQELGWTGFLLPHLQAHFSACAASLMRATLVIIWHIPLLIFTYRNPAAFPDFPYGAWMTDKGFGIAFFALVMFSLPWSVFITWLFNNTKGSLLLVALFHGSEVWLVYLMGLKSKSLENLVGYGVIMILAAITIMLVAGPENFSRRYQRIADSHKLS